MNSENLGCSPPGPISGPCEAPTPAIWILWVCLHPLAPVARTLVVNSDEGAARIVQAMMLAVVMEGDDVSERGARRASQVFAIGG